MNNCLTGRMRKVNLFKLIDELSTINENNLEEIELCLYALKGCACNNKKLIGFCNVLIETIDEVFDYLYIGEREHAERYIKRFKGTIEVMQGIWYLSDITL